MDGDDIDKVRIEAKTRDRHYTDIYTRMGHIQMGMARVRQKRQVMDIWRNAEEEGQDG